MTTALQTALVLLILLQVKHLFADFFFQTPRMLAGRDEYLHVGRAQHAGLHAVFSVLAFLIVGTEPSLIFVICVAEFILHYHIDWGKGVHSEIKKLPPSDAGYWRAFGIDQLAHQLTYVAMIWVWAAYQV